VARTALTPMLPPGKYPTLPLGALSAALTLVAGDNVNGNSVPSTGREIIIVQNTAGVAGTITVSSVADAFNRSGDITAYSVPAAGFAVLGPFPLQGWKQADGNLYLTVSAATMLVAVVQLPVGVS
jgi:hypothetical protein